VYVEESGIPGPDVVVGLRLQDLSTLWSVPLRGIGQLDSFVPLGDGILGVGLTVNTVAFVDPRDRRITRIAVPSTYEGNGFPFEDTARESGGLISVGDAVVWTTSSGSVAAFGRPSS
jgi:hypothetical protein